MRQREPQATYFSPLSTTMNTKLSTNEVETFMVDSGHRHATAATTATVTTPLSLHTAAAATIAFLLHALSIILGAVTT